MVKLQFFAATAEERTSWVFEKLYCRLKTSTRSNTRSKIGEVPRDHGDCLVAGLSKNMIWFESCSICGDCQMTKSVGRVPCLSMWPDVDQ